MRGTKRSAGEAGLEETETEKRQRQGISEVRVVKKGLEKLKAGVQKAEWALFKHPETKAARRARSGLLLVRMCAGLSREEEAFVKAFAAARGLEVVLRGKRYSCYRDGTEAQLRWEKGQFTVDAVLGTTVGWAEAEDKWEIVLHTSQCGFVWGPTDMPKAGALAKIFDPAPCDAETVRFLELLGKLDYEVATETRRVSLLELHPEARGPEFPRTWWKKVQARSAAAAEPAVRDE